MRNLAAGTACAALLLFVTASAAAEDGATLYRSLCASCHDKGTDRAPNRAALAAMTPDRVLAALESGTMVSFTGGRSSIDRRALAEFVSGKSFDAPLVTRPSEQAMCPPKTGDFPKGAAGPSWTFWGGNGANTRYQDKAGLTAADVPRLKVKWAFAFPGDIIAASQPTVVGGRLFVGSESGIVYALDAKSGCVHWFFQADAPIRAAIIVAKTGPTYAAFIADRGANVYAVDAGSGALLWRIKADTQPLSRVTGSPVFYNGRLYVPLTSSEEGISASSSYECCRFRGSLVALNAASGEQVWKTYTVADEAKPTKKNKVGTQLWGPSGATIWNAPTLDPMRNAIYVTTGDNYSDPPTGTSDAFIAFDLDSGKILWTRQTLARDAWNGACSRGDGANCPDSNGPDYDFASPPMLVTLPNGKRALIAGQKSGVVWAIDPDREGEVLWQTRVGNGGISGGVQWGSAADRSNVYVALADLGRITIPGTIQWNPDPKMGGGMFALRLDSGARVWQTPPPPCGDRLRCSPAQSAAVSAIPDATFSGSEDGHLRAYSTKTGAVLWDFDTFGTQKTVNGAPGRGGSLNGPGPAIVGGMLFVESGYGSHGMSGNLLLAFSLDGR
jgi:polyvinyl alcohol dehydrogenase (cytochrome)